MPTLYVKRTCHFCRKVLEFANAFRVDLTVKDVGVEPAALEELLKIGGKRQVPFLVDEGTGTSMYESEDIIAHLKNHHVG